MSDIRILHIRFNHTMSKWKVQLDEYSFLALCTKPCPESWSIGQVISHLIEETLWYFELVEVCLKTNDNAEKEIYPKIEKWLERNAFPNKRLKGPADLASQPQPESKDALLQQWEHLNATILMTAMAIASSQFCGKVAHPVHGYLNAEQWFQYAEQHMRHHFRQRKRIDKYLNLVSKSEKETVWFDMRLKGIQYCLLTRSIYLCHFFVWKNGLHFFPIGENCRK